MSSTFAVDAVLVIRDGIAVSHEHVWTWLWRRPSQPDTQHLIEYDSEAGVWTRGTRTPPGGWIDYPLWWPFALTHDAAERQVTALIRREPQ